MISQIQTVSPGATTASPLRRWLPLVVFGLVIALAYFTGLHQLLLRHMVEDQEWLQNFVAAHFVAAVVLYILAYILVTALSLPVASPLSIFGGFVLGWLASAPATIVGATLGAIITFKIVQTSLGATIAQRAGPFVARLTDGFEKNAFSYLLFLRLVPAFPFFAVNAVAGLTRMRLQTFALGTLIGIIPGCFCFAWLGRGLGSVLEASRTAHQACAAQGCGYEIPVKSLVNTQMLWALAGLGVISLVPLVLKMLKRNAV